MVLGQWKVQVQLSKTAMFIIPCNWPLCIPDSQVTLLSPLRAGLHLWSSPEPSTDACLWTTIGFARMSTPALFVQNFLLSNAMSPLVFLSFLFLVELISLPPLGWSVVKELGHDIQGPPSTPFFYTRKRGSVLMLNTCTNLHVKLKIRSTSCCLSFFTSIARGFIALYWQ
jgi:hypothetical protein